MCIAIRFIENLTLTDDYSGQKFKLKDWQKDIIRRLIPDSSRQYRKAFIFLPRGQGKTTLLAAIALYYLVAEQDGQQIVSAAADQKQAALIFDKCCQMIRADKWLNSILKIYETTKKIAYKKRNSTYQALSAEAYTKYGLNPSLIIADEVIAWPNRDLWDVLVSAQGKRANPLCIAITTAGEKNTESLCWELFTYAKGVESGEINDPSFLPVLYYAKDDEDWRSEETWKRVIPALSDFTSIEHIRNEYAEAQVLPTAEYRFRTLYLNQFVDNATAFVPMEKWDQCKAECGYKGVAYAGLDLSSTTDLSAFVLLFSDYSIKPYFFVPENACKHRERANKQRLDHWVRAGYIDQTAGDCVDYDHIRSRIKQIGQQYQINEIAVDPWNATQLAQQLQYDAFRVVLYPQTAANFNAPCKELQKLILEKRIKHDGNPVACWMMKNLKIDQDTNQNYRPSKKNSLEKIDYCVALLMALGRKMLNPEGSIYESGESILV